MRESDETVSFEDVDECQRETDKAILVNVDGQDRWVPKSVIHANSEVYEKGTSGTLVIAEWFAKKEGVI